MISTDAHWERLTGAMIFEHNAVDTLVNCIGKYDFSVKNRSFREVIVIHY